MALAVEAMLHRIVERLRDRKWSVPAVGTDELIRKLIH